MSKLVSPANADFVAFYERHWKYVYRLCYTYMHSEADAEDCTEDVFVKVLSGKFSFEDGTHERKWLTLTAINLCKDRLKSFARKNVGSTDDETTPDVTAPEAEDLSDVKDAVLSLPAKMKDAVWLYYYEGYSTDEIAHLLTSPPSTIRNRLRDARILLKKLLKGVFEYE